MSKGWRRNYNKRWITVDATGISIFKRHDARKERERIKYSIESIRTATEWTPKKSKPIKLRPNSVLLTLKDGTVYPFSVSREAALRCAGARTMYAVSLRLTLQ